MLQGKFYLQTVEGLEKLAAKEVRSLDPGLKVQSYPGGYVQISGDIDPESLLELKIPEDVFYLLYESDGITRSRSSLGEILNAVIRGEAFAQGVALRRAISRKWPKRVTYRVIARKEGRHNFNRSDLATAIYSAVDTRTNGRWRVVDSNANVEFWVTVRDTHCVIGVRLSDRTMRHRTYKTQHLEASLRPTVAHALVTLTQPKDDDVFCDPMCGAGTILIERGMWGRYRQLLGGDINPEAVEAAKGNIGPRFKPIEVKHWDATDLPLDSGSITAMAVNLPFGRKIGTPQEMQTLYPAFLKEAARVLEPGARLVVLTDQDQLFRRSLQDLPFYTEERVPVKILGHSSLILACRRI